MTRAFFALIATLFLAAAEAQPKKTPRKYPSLLWEISGNGLKKPSHLIGTMHVSSKLAFNLPDSFYLAIKNAEVVALETNPDTWQEDMSKYDLGEDGYGAEEPDWGSFVSAPNEYLNIRTLKFYPYNTKIERALSSNPSAINSLLYRSYGNESSDFEEDTYLDMYIYQCGKKWGKRVTGVEAYGQSMQLMAEAYRDAAKDKNRKVRSYGDIDEAYSSDKLQEAYRTGNLDLLDSINLFNSESPAFDEKFLYRRNEIQAASIDSILRSGSTLFAGVGAAHLPGERGVIEILRKKGYRLRPVKMGERASRDKELVDRIRVPVVFQTARADDGQYSVDIPGKFYKFGEDASLDQRQYADMSNGSYYMVTRIMTNAWMWNHGSAQVYRSIDSLLYENVPGKIISKSAISKNGYQGFDITNRTRRGDLQRYQVFITPFEIILFKMSGTGDYIRNGPEAGRFFGSIQLKEYRNGTAAGALKKYTPPFGGFSAALPHEPYIGNDGSWIFDAMDRHAGLEYRIIRSDVHNYHFAEEDSFDLSLMEESFAASGFIDTLLQRRLFSWKGYPALDCKFRDKYGGIYRTRFLVQGPHYYSLVAHGRQEHTAMEQFFESFELKPFVYGEAVLQKDTALYYAVTAPPQPGPQKIKLDIPRYGYYGEEEEEPGMKSEDDLLESGTLRNKIVRNDTTGEKIFVSFYRSPRYYYTKDSSALDRDNEQHFFGGDSTWIIRSQRKSILPNGMKVWEVLVSDTGSSRVLRGKSFYRDGISFSLATQTDTLTPPSAFIRQFFESFTPADTLRGINPFEKKSGLFFSDFFSPDSLLKQRAVRHISEIELDSTDLPQLQNAIGSMNWEEKKYLGTKTALIRKLGDIPVNASADYLGQLYHALGDTVELQYTVLESLLQHRTAYAYHRFRDIITTEPPVLGITINSGTGYRYENGLEEDYDPADNGSFLDELYDSLALTRGILPALLPLLDLDDYKPAILKLLGRLVDSNLVKPSDYSGYFSRFLIEARQELKRQSVLEKKKAIEKAVQEREKNKPAYSAFTDEEKDSGNAELGLYATLLLPHADTNRAVQSLIRQMLASSDKELKFTTLLLLLRNNKPVPDSLFRYFAGLDDYAYPLYSRLSALGQLRHFPEAYRTHTTLAKSWLLQKKQYGKPDSLLYISRLPASFRSRNGYLYFFKYKVKKDDITWKLAVAGLVPEDPGQFLYAESSSADGQDDDGYAYNPWSFTAFTETKLTGGSNSEAELRKLLKRLLYARRKSARNFYEGEQERSGAGEYGD